MRRLKEEKRHVVQVLEKVFKSFLN
jgi:hypothetical protein